MQSSPIKGNVKRNISPSARCRSFFVSAFSPTVLTCTLDSSVLLLRPSLFFRFRVRSAGTFPLPCGSISLLWRRHSFSETASLTVIHSMSGNAWSYWRLVAYGFLGLSERA